MPVDTALCPFGSEIVQIECLHLHGPVSVSVDTIYNYNIQLMLHIIYKYMKVTAAASCEYT